MIVDFIKYLKEYECSTEPTSIKIIVGTKILDDDGQSIGGDFPIEIYRQFKHVAFFINKPKCVLRSA